MPRQAGVAASNNFIQGLITEATALRFPENAATEAENTVFDETGRVSRRLGFDIEESASATDFEIADSDTVYTEYRWDAVNGDGGTSFLVQQIGSILYFFDVSSSSSVVPNDTGLTIDLTDFQPSGSAFDPGNFPCQYASGRGKLLVVNRGTDPFYISFDPDTITLTGTAIEIKIRDFQGLEDGLEEGERPTSSVPDLITNNPEHYYNLLNQSWFIGDALSQWDTARSDLPSNRDYVGLYRDDPDDAFDNAQVTANTPGTRPAPKGHFIFDAFCPDHTQTMADEGFTATITADEVEINLDPWGAGADTVGDFSDPEIAFDGDTTQIANDCSINSGVDGYIGVSFSNGGGGGVFAEGGSGFPKRITKAIVHGSNDSGFSTGGNGSTTITLYGKQGDAPSSSTDGTLLGTSTFSDTSDESAGRTITSSDTDTFWDHVWVRIQVTDATMRVAELRLFTSAQQEAIFCTTERPTCVEFFAGRAWFAGVNFSKLATNLYFSQIVTKDDQFGKCFQQNDPASEDFTDLLPDDGGVIVIPEIGTVKRLHAYQAALIIIATNGVWLITGGTSTGFTANDFSVKKLSTEGSNAPLSLLSFKGLPAWWTSDGINTLQFDANYQSFQVVSLTDTKIHSFIRDIPAENIQFVKATFDLNEEVGYWLYSSTEGTEYEYDSVLVVNGLAGSFSPWTISTPGTVSVRGISYAQPPTGATPKIAYTASVTDSSQDYIFYAETRNTEYLDWTTLAVDLGDDTLETDYDTDFITGYRLDGQALRFFQSPYIVIYLEDETNASCYVQGIFDFSNSGNSGKWSTPQQCYRETPHRDVSQVRLKIRGKGRSMQLKFSSESGKPFTIIGWAVLLSSNAGV